MQAEKSIIKILFTYAIFWLLFFVIARSIFFIYFASHLNADSIRFSEVLLSYLYGFRLDITTISYLLVFPFFTIVIQSFTSKKFYQPLTRFYIFLFIVLFSLLYTAELGTYEEWLTKLPYKALNYLRHPAEIAGSASTLQFFSLIFFFLLQSIIFIGLYLRFFEKKFPQQKPNYIVRVLILSIFPVFILLGIRGGVQQIPVNQSQSYFSKHNILNIGAVNSAYSFFHSVYENIKNINQNPFAFYDEKEATKIVKQINTPLCDTTLKVLKTQRPNIILIILESWSADLIEQLGGKPGITPCFNNLMKDGILFTKVFSSGTRSEQGMACILSGFPAHPLSSITVQPDKFVKLPGINKELKKVGYFSSFYFGGQLIYGNMKGYIMSNRFDKVTEIYDFNKEKNIIYGKLGVHDEFLFNRVIKDLEYQKEPFFTVAYTLSTHSPYDQPMKDTILWGGKMKGYLNAAYYTDKCIGNFIEKARKQPWFKNTLFVFVADHGHPTYRKWHPFSPNFFHLPLFFYGDVIKDEFKNTKISHLGTQYDIASTLLPLLGLDDSAFRWSKNLLNPCSPQYAYFAFEEGVGWIRPKGYFVYDKKTDRFFFLEINKKDIEYYNRLIKEGKSYLQEVFQAYMQY
ncbi:MAG: sulfatase-like hydrolase/transferase [Lentimicrobiaceae bacterium]|nr:sulfatase-like hydrolase/transferase [Lentimicrobiaceae bacterium]